MMVGNGKTNARRRVRVGNPWDEWVPGVLNKEQMGRLLDEGFITFPGARPTLDHSSMDLTLSDEAYEMTGGSVEPSQRSYSWYIKKHGLARACFKNRFCLKLGTYV
jgi:hypothetical protein